MREISQGISTILGQLVLKITVHFHLIYESNPLERQPFRAAISKENF
jgi:hypothetical protein